VGAELFGGEGAHDRQHPVPRLAGGAAATPCCAAGT